MSSNVAFKVAVVTFMPTSRKGKMHGAAFLGGFKGRLPRHTHAPFLATFPMKRLSHGVTPNGKEAGIHHLSHNDVILPTFVNQVPHKHKLLRNSYMNAHVAGEKIHHMSAGGLPSGLYQYQSASSQRFQTDSVFS